MKEGEVKGLIKLFEIAYLKKAGRRRRLFTNFSNLMELERLHSIKFIEKYQNRVACQDFISATGDNFFLKFVKVKTKF